MTAGFSFIAELKRRNVVRAALVYAAAVWALAQGIAQLTPVVGAPDWVARWFLFAACIGFPFWIAFAWFYAWTPDGFKREEEVDHSPSTQRATSRKLDFWIIGIMAVAIVLLVTNQFVLRRDATSVADKSDAKAIAAALAKVPAKSVAVLPLANESGDPKQAYFSDGLSEELISDLTRIDGLKVIGKTSSFKFRDSDASPAKIGATLGVAHLIEGSVRQRGEKLRVVVNLIDARDGASIWSHTYDQQLEDVFAIQSQIGKAVAAALKIQLLGKPIVNEEQPPSGNMEAYRAAMQGRALGRRGGEEGYRQAVALFEKAVRIDPDYAYAWGLLSNYEINLGMNYLHGQARQDAYARARLAIDKVMTLAPGTVNAHLSRAYVLATLDSDFRAALDELRPAHIAQPQDNTITATLAFLNSVVGNLPESERLYRKALETDPLRADWYAALASLFEADGRLDDAEEALRTVESLQPDFPYLNASFGWLGVLRGDVAEVKRRAASTSDPQAKLSFEIALARMQGERAKADAGVTRYISAYGKTDAFGIAELYAIAQRPDEMFQWLDKARERGDPLAGLLFDPFLLRYKDDPRFAAFCKQIGLPPPGTPAFASPRTSAASP